MMVVVAHRETRHLAAQRVWEAKHLCMIHVPETVVAMQPDHTHEILTTRHALFQQALPIPRSTRLARWGVLVQDQPLYAKLEH